MPLTAAIDRLARSLDMSTLLEELTKRYGGYELRAHWTQGEFHNDTVLWLTDEAAEKLHARVLVIATNCNGGVKEVLAFAEMPERSALWHFRCPAVPEFTGDLPPILARATTFHWFDPTELLGPDARSELRPEFRKRQTGGGWRHTDDDESEPR